MLRFLGRARQLRWVLRGVYVYLRRRRRRPRLAGLVSPAARSLALSRTWSWHWLAGLLPLSAVIVVVLLIHLRRASSVEERYRTWMLLAAVVVISPLASSEVWADLGLRRAPSGQRRHPVLQRHPDGWRRCASGCSIEALSPSTALTATIIAAVGGIAYLSMFRMPRARTPRCWCSERCRDVDPAGAARLIVGTRSRAAISWCGWRRWAA